MDKWERRDIGYKTDWEDGYYYVTHIVNETPEDEERSKRIVCIEKGSVRVLGGRFSFSQDEFFEVNKVLRKTKLV